MVMSTSAVGAITGPVVGGALASAHWRWIFYINIPISGAIIFTMLIFLHLKHEKAPTWYTALEKVDWIGNIVFISSLCSLLIGIVSGGVLFPWSSWRIVLPIVLGSCGWAAFHIYEAMGSTLCPEPSVPPRIFRNQTSAAALYISFMSSMLLQWVCFFWPIYFQGIQGTSPLHAGINFIPYEAFLIVTAAVAGVILSRFGSYRTLHLLGFGLSITGPGLNIMLSQSTPKSVWVVFQCVDAIGRGMLLPTVLPAVMASLPDSDAAAATGMYSFLRSFGFVWGVTIPGAIFNTQFERQASRISDIRVRHELGSGRAYQAVSGAYIKALSPDVHAEVLSVYHDALRVVWITAVGFGATGLVAVAL
jgi:MFS family permease